MIVARSCRGLATIHTGDVAVVLRSYLAGTPLGILYGAEFDVTAGIGTRVTLCADGSRGGDRYAGYLAGGHVAAAHLKLSYTAPCDYVACAAVAQLPDKNATTAARMTFINLRSLQVDGAAAVGCPSGAWSA